MIRSSSNISATLSTASVMIKPVSLAIADDQALGRTTLKLYLSGKNGINVVALASNLSDLLNSLKVTLVDVLLIDLFLPGFNGSDAIKAIRNECSDIKILVLSESMDLDLIGDLLDSGIYGYISKTDDPDDLLRAIKIVSGGDIYRNRFFTEAFYLKSQNSARTYSEKSSVMLNEREKKILRLIWEEKSNKEIADELLLGIRSVEKLRQDLKEKIGVKSTVGMLKYAIRAKIIKANFLQGHPRLMNHTKESDQI
jgi:DNA-binding NarL/FixJ family response regulator